MQARASARTLPPRASRDSVTCGAGILDSNPPLPDRRQFKDVAFAGCFVVIVLALTGICGMFFAEIPKAFERGLTKYTVVTASLCSGKAPFIWKVSDAIKTDAHGVDIRSDLEQRSSHARRLAVMEGPLDEAGGVDVGFVEAAPVELPGLSEFIRRLKSLGVQIGTEGTGDDPHEVGEASGSDLQSADFAISHSFAAPAPGRADDCERACAAFEECTGFTVVSRIPPKCTYYMGTVESRSSSSENSCWTKRKATELGSSATTLVFKTINAIFTGGLVSVLMAFVFVKCAASNPAAATYCGIYFVPGLLIAVGLCIAAGASLLTMGAMFVLLGAMLVLWGSCMCFCVRCCWWELIPLTIEVIATVTSIITKYMSMMCIGLCGALISILWALICAMTVLGAASYFDRGQATMTRSSLKDASANAVEHYGQIFAYSLVYIWGGYVAFNTCHVAFSGVFGRWYYGKDGAGTVANSLGTACTSAFGSICLGSLIIAVVQALEQVAKRVQQDAQEEGNTVLCVIACIIGCILGCIGDFIEWISSYAYVQVAMRGLSFCEGCKATYALATISNLNYVISSVLCDWVVTMATCLCAVSGAIVSGLLGYVFGKQLEFTALILASVCFIFGCCVGGIAGGSAVRVITSGSQTILMCWAEEPDVLQKTYPQIHRRFTESAQGAQIHGHGEQELQNVS